MTSSGDDLDNAAIVFEDTPPTPPLPFPPGLTCLVDMDQVKDRLNIDPYDSTDDVELTLYLQSACGVLTDLYGDVLPAQYVEITEVYGDDLTIMLGRSPVLSVELIEVMQFTSSTQWLTLLNTRYWLDGPVGVVHFLEYPSNGFLVFNTNRLPRIRVHYTAGRAAITPQVQDAVLELLRINWQPQRGGPTDPMDPDQGFTYLGYYVPNGVNERLAAGKRPRQIG